MHLNNYYTQGELAQMTVFYVNIIDVMQKDVMQKAIITDNRDSALKRLRCLVPRVREPDPVSGF